MNVYLAGEWDGINLWLQWEDVSPDKGYEVQVRCEDLPQWTDWKTLFGHAPYKRSWAVAALHCEGHKVEARVRAMGSTDWWPAQEVKFKKSRCSFEIASTQNALHLLEGTRFTACVDGAVATYVLSEEIEIPAGGSAHVEMTALQSTGYCQLDSAGHFLLRPSLGVTVKNIGPSVEDIEETGRDFTIMAHRKPDGRPMVAFGPNILHQ